MKKSRLLKAIIASFILVLVVISISYAWIYNNKTVDITDISIITVSANDLEFSEDGAVWKAEFLTGDIGDIEFEPVLGDGINFFTYTKERQLVDSGEGYEMYGDVITGNEQIAEDDYSNYFLYKEYDVKSDYDIHLYFQDITMISPLDTTNEKRINAYGVSKDNIAGAMRLAIYIRATDADEWEPKFFWIPNANYELASDKSFNANGTAESSYRYTNSLTDYTDITPDSGSNTKEIDGVTYYFGDINTKLYLFDVPQGYSQMLISIWLEETDREADNSLSGGLLNICLAFDSTIIEDED